MNKILLFLLLYSSYSFANNDEFIKKAKILAADLKSSLMQNLSKKISSDGVEKAIPFCHSNVGPIAKDAAKDRMKEFEFGRTSHKVRNSANSAQAWANQYLKDFSGKKKGEMKNDQILHTLENGKRVYMEALYVEAKCLLCHGENISKNVSAKINELYPNDKAKGFTLGEFRGFIWVKEK